MVISSTLAHSSVFQKINNISNNKIFKIFGICKKYFSYIILGIICGFINGSRLIYQTEENANKDTSSSAILSTQAGTGLVVSFVGGVLWESIKFGILLYFFQIIFSLILNKLILPYETNGNTQTIKFIVKNIQEKSITNSICNAITTSFSSFTVICSFTVFFSIILKICSKFFNLKENMVGYAIISSLLEFSNGVKSSVLLTNIPLAGFFTGFSVGFGGICVAMQTFSVCAGINKKKYLAFKLLEGIACGIISAFLVSQLSLVPCIKIFSTNTLIFKNKIIDIFITFTLLLSYFVTFFYISEKKKKRT